MNALALERIVREALLEDIGTGDVTTDAVAPIGTHAQGLFEAKADGVLAGFVVVREVIRQVDPRLVLAVCVEDGELVHPGQTLAIANGSAASILLAERVALNFLQRLSGIATLTARYVALTAGTKARIADTRKTTPGLRMLEKWAVRAGGGSNHRMGLYDAVMIKDNHIEAAGGITPAVARARAAAPHTMTITVECETLDQVREALVAGANILLLDNMSPGRLAEAVGLVNGAAVCEASGGVSLETVAAIARTGVDVISVGALTHSAPALDISLNLTLDGGE